MMKKTKTKTMTMMAGLTDRDHGDKVISTNDFDQRRGDVPMY
jgi:hypothetical protein